MQSYERDSRLLLLHDSDTKKEEWLRRRSLLISEKKHVDYIYDAEVRGSVTPLTRKQIIQLFLGPDYKYLKSMRLYARGDMHETNEGHGICYHATTDIHDNYFKVKPEGPNLAHVLWKQTRSELRLRSIAVDSEFHFRTLMYDVLVSELKLLIMQAAGWGKIQEMNIPCPTDSGLLRFLESEHFRLTQSEKRGSLLAWKPEFEGLEKENSTHRDGV